MPTDADASPSTSALLVVVLTVDYTTGTGETLGLGGALAEWLLSTPPPTPAPLQPGVQPRPWWLSTRTSSPSHWQPPVSFYAAVGRSPSSCTRRGRELRLNYRGGSSWSLHVALSLDDAALRSLLASDSLTYHYCVLDEHDGVLRREAPPEHRVRLALHEPASAAAFAGPAAIVVHDTWQVRCRVCVRAPGAHSLTPSLPHSLTPSLVLSRIRAASRAMCSAAAPSPPRCSDVEREQPPRPHTTPSARSTPCCRLRGCHWQSSRPAWCT